MAAESQRKEPRHAPPLPAAPTLARGANARQPRPGPARRLSIIPRAAPIGLERSGGGERGRAREGDALGNGGRASAAGWGAFARSLSSSCPSSPAPYGALCITEQF